MFSVQIIAYPWDLEDEGIEHVLDVLQGEIGVQGISVVAASGPLCELRARPDASPRIFRSRGGIFFQPDDSHYANTRIKPILSRWLKTRNPIATIAAACHKRDMKLRFILPTRRIGRVADRFPVTVAKSAFGDASDLCICPINLDVEAFLQGLVTDLCQNYAPDSIELYGMDRAFETGVLATSADRYALGPGGEALYSVCFCESCRQSATRDGVDAEAAARSAGATLSRAIESGRVVEGSLEDLLGADRVLDAYVATLRDRHIEVVGRLSDAASCDLVLHVSAAADRNAKWLSRVSSGCARLNAEADIPLSESPDDALTFAHDVAGRRDDLHCEAQIPAREATFGDPPLAVQAMKLLVDRGVGGVNLDHYGVMGQVELASAKQAVRYARRAANIG